MTSVDTSPDLKSAKVYVSVLGEEPERKETLEGLECSCGYMQSLIAKQLSLKRTPQLVFIYDESIEHGLRIEKLLKDIDFE